MLATYRGVPYEAGVGPTGSDVVLFAACPPPEELGFEPATGHWRKRVIRAEIDALWESRPIGTFRGEPCLVLDDLGDRLHIAYLGTDAGSAARLGYWQIDRGVFELLVPRDDVVGLMEERVDKPLVLAPSPFSPYQEPGQPYPYESGQYETGRYEPGHAGAVPEAGGGIPLPDADGGMPVPRADGAIPVPPAGGTIPVPRADDARPGPLDGPLPSPTGRDGFPSPAGTGPDVPAEGSGLPAPAGAGGPSPAGYAAGLPAPAAPAGFPPPAPRGGGNGGRSARRQRATIRDVFCELADQAAIPRTAYALGTEVDGALCLIATGAGFEVFVPVDGARHEVRSFSDEEAAYFYLFGVLAAEAIQGGVLAPARLHDAAM